MKIIIRNNFHNKKQKIMKLHIHRMKNPFKKLNRMMVNELSCNQFLIHMVQRFFLHRQDPVMAYFEEKQLDLFISGRQSFKSLIQTMRRDLESSF